MSVTREKGMSAVLRAAGAEFDVDAFVRASGWAFARVFRRGELEGPGARRRPSEMSGLSVVVSEAGFGEFGRQVAEAIEFLRREGAEVRRLVESAGVGEVVLDFGIEWRDVAAQFDRFPAELVRLAGACGIGLEVSHYPVAGA